jgi:hypothetical protein
MPTEEWTESEWLGMPTGQLYAEILGTAWHTREHGIRYVCGVPMHQGNQWVTHYSKEIDGGDVMCDPLCDFLFGAEMVKWVTPQRSKKKDKDKYYAILVGNKLILKEKILPARS